MGFWKSLFILLPVFGLGAALAQAAEDGFSGRLSTESGSFQSPNAGLGLFQFSRIILENQGDLLPNLSFNLSAEADWQTAGSAALPPWPGFPVPNALSLEVDHSSANVGSDFYFLRMDRASLKWVSGRLDLSLGLQNLDWGSSFFYRPTDYFFPLSPFDLVRDQPLPSEAVDLSFFLIDDFSLEGTVRWVEDGRPEALLRLVNRGIGLTFTPSFAWLEGREGLGLKRSELFRISRYAGRGWIGGCRRVCLNSKWIAGISTLENKGMTYNLEVFQDGTGTVLGKDSTGDPSAVYFFASFEGKLAEDWKSKIALVKSPGGGPFLFWPQLEWNFEAAWSVQLEGQLLVVHSSGSLGNNPSRLWPRPLVRVSLKISYNDAV